MQKEKPKTKQTHKPQNQQNCADTRFWLIYFAFFVFFFPGDLHTEYFLVIWCVLVFSVFVDVKFLCWNRCHTRSNERNRVCVCIQPNPAISNHIYPRSNHIYPRHVFWGSGSLSPSLFIHFDFFFLLIGTILYVKCFCCWIPKKDIQKDLHRLLCESNQVQLFPSMPKV